MEIQQNLKMQNYFTSRIYTLHVNPPLNLIFKQDLKCKCKDCRNMRF